MKNQKTINQFKKQRLEKLASLMKKYGLSSGDWNIIDGFIPLENFLLKSIDQATKIERKRCLDCVGEDKLGIEEIEKAVPKGLSNAQMNTYWNMRGISYGYNQRGEEIRKRILKN